METKYYKFLSNFIVKSKRERLIYELQSEKKRENAFSKMTNFLDCFNSEDIIVDLTHFQDDIAIKRIEEVVSNKECFDILNGERNLLKSAGSPRITKLPLITAMTQSKFNSSFVFSI